MRIPTITPTLVVASLFGWGLAACGASASSRFMPSDAAVEFGDDAAGDAALSPDAPVPCAGNFCAPSQYCVHPCMGGTLVCFFVEDGGACPPNTQPARECVPTGATDAGGQYCRENPSPAVYSCVDNLSQAGSMGCDGANVIAPGQIGCACPL
jgi:hypothetical protein